MDVVWGALGALIVAGVVVLGCAFLIGGRYEVVAGPTSYVQIDRLTGDMVECRDARCRPVRYEPTPVPPPGYVLDKR